MDIENTRGLDQASLLNTSPERGATRAGPELCVIVPTFNELGNVDELVHRVRESLANLEWELLFVDDNSPDGTAARVRELGQKDPRVRCLQRIGRRGLSSACIEGMLATSANFMAVIDGDLQHDETLLPSMLERLKGDELDIVVGSRYVEGGGIGTWNQSRAFISQFATRLSRTVLKAELGDPMSGFFMIRWEPMEKCVRNLSGIGFKILVDLFASSPTPLKFAELPYEFRERHAGESKLDTQAVWAFLMLLLDKLVGRWVPVRLIAFSLVGGIGVVVHLVVLGLLHTQAGLDFFYAQTSATLVAMTSNFAMNNVFTYRDKRLKGWKWLRGWFSFVGACSIGAVANVGIASYLFDFDVRWFLAAIAGIMVGTVWNFAVTRFWTWRDK